MKRAERRRKEATLKRLWFRRLRKVARGNTKEECEKWDGWAVRLAAKRAHHNKCTCDTCTGWEQRRRRRDVKRSRQEGQRVEHVSKREGTEA